MTSIEQTQSCFYRSLHDKQNPYAQISREMLQDRNLSLKAKGLLCYLLSLPHDWKIFHVQLMNALNIGEACLNSTIKELIDNGYAKRERIRLANGQYSPYRYEISEFKLFLPNGIFQPGSSRPENPGLQKKEISSIQNKQQQNAAASFQSKKEEIKNPAIYTCLLDLPLTQDEMKQVTKSNTEERIKEAVKLARSKQTPPKNLAGFVIWAANEGVKAPLTEEQNIDENRNYAKKIEYNLIIPKEISFYAGHMNAEISFMAQKAPIVISYTETAFINLLSDVFKQYNIKIKDT